jgi:RimJ/RimL family protein N-acetyltransferase
MDVILKRIAKQFFQKVNPPTKGGIPTLLTQRLRLRAPTHSDYENILALGSDPEVMRYITYGKTQSPRDARADLERRIQLSQGAHGYWITEDQFTSDFIGWMALRPLPGKDHFELGYRFLKKHWGKGYATEAGQQLLQYAFQELNLPKVIAIAMPENQASRRVMEKLGLQFMGYDQFHGVDCVIYQISSRDFALASYQKK